MNILTKHCQPIRFHFRNLNQFHINFHFPNLTLFFHFTFRRSFENTELEWCALLSMWLATRRSNTFRLPTWRGEASIGSSTSAGIECHNVSSTDETVIAHFRFGMCHMIFGVPTICSSSLSSSAYLRRTFFLLPLSTILHYFVFSRHYHHYHLQQNPNDGGRIVFNRQRVLWISWQIRRRNGHLGRRKSRT